MERGFESYRRQFFPLFKRRMKKVAVQVVCLASKYITHVKVIVISLHTTVIITFYFIDHYIHTTVFVTGTYMYKE